MSSIIFKKNIIIFCVSLQIPKKINIKDEIWNNFADNIQGFSGEYGVIGIFIDGKRVLHLEFENTGSWVENYNMINVEIDIPECSTFSIGYDEGDTAMNINCIVPNE